MRGFATSSKMRVGLAIGMLVLWQSVCTISALDNVCHMLACPEGNLKVAAFNIKDLGKAKIGKPAILKALVKIISKYDLVLIQEIIDKDETTVPKLKKEVNAVNLKDPFQEVTSGRLGRRNRKEQYSFFYRPSKVRVAKMPHQWPDVADDFEYEPFIVHFWAPAFDVKDFGFIGIHAKPDSAVLENDELADVYDKMKALWGFEDFIIGGDLNAGCDYVKPNEFAKIRLWTQARFDVVIGHNVKTNIAANPCPYDRFVLAGERLKKAYVDGSANAYHFDEDADLMKDVKAAGFEAKNVSDHRPIELELE